jgi:hypothetical protein
MIIIRFLPSFRSFCACLTLFLSGTRASGQCQNPNRAFQEGESLLYEVYYEWQFVALNAAYVSFKVSEQKYRGIPCFHLQSTGATHPAYHWIFRVQDEYQAWAEQENLQPLKSSRDVSEGKYWAHDQVFFDPGQAVRLITFNRERPMRADTISSSQCILDPLTAAYVARNINLSQALRFQTFPIHILLDNRIHAIHIRFHGKETLMDNNRKEIPCYKLSAFMEKGSLFSGGSEIIVWVTADQNQVPFQVEAEILVGKIKVRLADYSGLRNPSVLK